MHELSIAMSIIDMVQEESAQRGGVQVKAVHLKIGALAGVAMDALLSSYEIASQETPLAGSQLVLEETPVTVLCSKCGAERLARSSRQLCCAICGTPSAKVVQGRELMVTGMEVLE